jgi:hypothetical protein
MSTRTLRCGPWACTTVLQVALLQTKHCYPPFLGAPPSTAWGAFPLAAPPLAGTTSFSDRRGGSTNPGGSSIATLRIFSDAARGLTARAARCTSVCDTVLARPTRLFRRPAPFPTEPYKVSSLVDAAGRLPGGHSLLASTSSTPTHYDLRIHSSHSYRCASISRLPVNVCRPSNCCHPVNLLASVARRSVWVCSCL